MIRKTILKGLLIIGIIFLGNKTNALTLVPVGMSSQLAGGNTCTIQSDLTINCELSNNVLSINKTYLSYDKMFNYFWSRDGIGIYFKDKNGTGEKQGLIKDGFFICEGNFDYNRLVNNTSYLGGNDCLSQYDKVQGLTYSGLIQKLYSDTPLYWWNCDNQFGGCLTLFYSGFYFNLQGDFSDFNVFNGNLIEQNLGFVGNSFDSINYNNSVVISNPLNVGFDGLLTGGGIVPGSEYSAINYYEKTYGWNKSICYAGVSNLDYLYGQNGVSFQEGQGLSIFDVFSGVYGNTDLNKVYVWLNVQLFNYQNWFNFNGTNQGGVGYPSWLGNYNSGTNQIDIYYDNLEFPFLNKPVAFYFLADNITSQSSYLTMGSSVVSYCNLKINGGSFDEIIDQADKNNITDYTEKSNTNKALNPDGTQKEYTGYWVGSGVDLAFSGNVSIKNTLKNFFDEFDKGLSIIDINTNNRILPTWIVSAFIFVVLFKFLRKR